MRDTALWRAALRLARDVDALDFEAPVTHVYNPLQYAGPAHREYLRRYGATGKKIVFLGMNPGPWGMAQTGVPFGEVAHVRDWLEIHTTIGKPEPEHPKRAVTGFACTRSEDSGRRLWGAFKAKYKNPDRFFRERFVANYCPLLFLHESGKNLTPRDLPSAKCATLYEPCDRHLRTLCRVLEPEWVIGVGGFAEERALKALAGTGIQVGRILHPSRRNASANQDWAGKADAQLRQYGLAL
jgi:single-strand selective monofunctional uracil DNA glycosylase